MELSDLATQLGALIGVQPATLLLYIGLITAIANAGARLIPNDATGALGVLRKICSILGVYISSRVTSGVTVNDVAAAAATTPPIDDKAKEEAAK